jgi:hypothetical protein
VRSGDQIVGYTPPPLICRLVPSASTPSHDLCQVEAMAVFDRCPRGAGFSRYLMFLLDGRIDTPGIRTVATSTFRLSLAELPI